MEPRGHAVMMPPIGVVLAIVPTRCEYRRVLAAATENLARAGFDLVHRFDVRACATEIGIPALGTGALGVFVGNTRALWPIFSAARTTDPELASSSDPLELYTERMIDRVAAALPEARLFYSHRQYDGAFLPLQRLAVAAGIGALSPTHLVIHPIYGPWFALRAVIVCDGQPPARTSVARACTCDARCTAAFDRALASSGPERWRAWLAVREACTVGRDYRYSDEQIAYHYSFLR
jgi:cyanocobalamin reductase (cyanide-eliminating) / alkylcobalamin dealkylase